MGMEQERAPSRGHRYLSAAHASWSDPFTWPLTLFGWSSALKQTSGGSPSLAGHFCSDKVKGIHQTIKTV